MAGATAGERIMSSTWTAEYERTPTGKLRAVGLPDDQRVYASWIHWASLIAWVSVVASSGVAFVIPALVSLAMWQIRKADGAFIDDHGREALNFQISLVLIGLILIPLVLCGVGVIGFIVLPFFGIIGTILAGTAALRSEIFRYPACIRVIPDRPKTA
ncbi:MAG: DUF4870 domain-containing protein [Planctomycetota bacterium]